jgi:hypothetical protein
VPDRRNRLAPRTAPCLVGIGGSHACDPVDRTQSCRAMASATEPHTQSPCRPPMKSASPPKTGTGTPKEASRGKPLFRSIRHRAGVLAIKGAGGSPLSRAGLRPRLGAVPAPGVPASRIRFIQKGEGIKTSVSPALPVGVTETIPSIPSGAGTGTPQVATIWLVHRLGCEGGTRDPPAPSCPACQASALSVGFKGQPDIPLSKDTS